MPPTVYATADDFAVPAAALAMFSAGDKTDALEKASQLADGYLNGRFQLPLLQWGDDLTEAVGAIATYKLIMKRGFKPGSVDNAQLYQSYKDATAWLASVAKGSITPTNIVDSSAGGANNTDAAGEARAASAATVVQTYGGTFGGSDESDFWGHETGSDSAEFGPSRRRGW